LKFFQKCQGAALSVGGLDASTILKGSQKALQTMRRDLP